MPGLGFVCRKPAWTYLMINSSCADPEQYLKNKNSLMSFMRTNENNTK